MPALRPAVCRCDVTPPAGQPLCGGWIEPVRGVGDDSFTHFGFGQAKVDQVASIRRILGPDGRVRFTHTSATKNPDARAEPEGLIDPWLKTLRFWNGGQPLAALHSSATHPLL
jgi:hypothetical protein